MCTQGLLKVLSPVMKIHRNFCIRQNKCSSVRSGGHILLKNFMSRVRWLEKAILKFQLGKWVLCHIVEKTHQGNNLVKIVWYH